MQPVVGARTGVLVFYLPNCTTPESGLHPRNQEDIQDMDPICTYIYIYVYYAHIHICT